MHRRIQCRQLIAEGSLVPVLFNEVGNIVVLVPLQRDGAPGEWSGGRHAGRKVIRVVVDLQGFVVTRDHEYALVGFTNDGTLLSQVIKISIGVVDEAVAAEKIVGCKILGVIVHVVSLSGLSLSIVASKTLLHSICVLSFDVGRG